LRHKKRSSRSMHRVCHQRRRCSGVPYSAVDATKWSAARIPRYTPRAPSRLLRGSGLAGYPKRTRIVALGSCRQARQDRASAGLVATGRSSRRTSSRAFGCPRRGSTGLRAPLGAQARRCQGDVRFASEWRRTSASTSFSVTCLLVLRSRPIVWASIAGGKSGS
jgi:hypothetical protein